MHAIRQHELGPPETLRYEEVADPEPATGQVRIAVAAIGVHLVDTMIRRGAGPATFARPQLPMTPGREVAGTVDAIGDGVDAAWLGARVVAHLGLANGGYAERAVASVDALHEIPAALDDEAAVAMIGTGRTAMAILETAALRPDDVVVVTAAAGGLGSLLVQAGRAAGATVVGLAGGPEKTARAGELGASVALDYLADGWPDRVRAALDGRAVSVVLDGVGGATARAALQLLGSEGRMIVFGLASGEPAQFTTLDVFGRGITVAPGIRAGFADRDRKRALETRALAEAAAGRLVALVTRFALADAAAAHRAIEARATVGKTVLVP